MRNYAQAVEAYHDLNPSSFPVLVRLETREEPDLMRDRFTRTLELELRPITFEDNRRLLLIFWDVRSLMWTPVDSAPLQYSQIEVYSVHDRQWENINYIVRELQRNELYFMCANFDASIIEVTSPLVSE
jgi:hypothetical protein